MTSPSKYQAFPRLCATVLGVRFAPIPEYRFHPERRWRFDFAWPDHLVALEVEGGVWSGGRHTRPRGFLADIEKYNAATTLGWRVLRTTPEALYSTRTLGLIKQALNTPDR